ncbi:ribosome recycling factor [Candidatus Providencia siddallii]|uniref:Ribosome-recycling factor n=1 Tax=Candidatus Providencia siddallii TaxID=1715285 RepID=A0ABM9NNX5_9GAMM
MINEIHKDAKNRMEKSIEILKNQINKIHAGRISPNILDNIIVECYGSTIPIRQLSNITVENSSTLNVSVFDKKTLHLIEKAIITSNLDLNTSSSGNIIRILFPPLTEDRRKKLIKIIRNNSEQNKITIRNIRRYANDKIKILLKDKKITEDEERKSQDYIQKLTDKFIKITDEILTQKETELLKF